MPSEYEVTDALKFRLTKEFNTELCVESGGEISFPLGEATR